MVDLKLGEPFGLDPVLIDSIDWELAVNRVITDQRSDFIYAPHLGFAYKNARIKLIKGLRQALQSGKFSPGIPLTIEVPKSFRMRVAATPVRLGPNYSRPGSILLPADRLLYQALSDQAAPIIKSHTLHSRCFSHDLAEPKSPTMFKSTRFCWNKLQAMLSEQASIPSVRYVLRIDVANFFGSINQHTLINILNDAGLNKSVLTRLEHLLIHYTSERSSRGILQGMNPSDLIGNFYLTPIDQYLEDYQIQSARYVDDIYVFVESVEAAERLLRDLVPTLRGYDLVLNEAKSVLLPKGVFRAEEPDLEALFAAAVDEISTQVFEDFNVDYGFQTDWDDEINDQTGELKKDELELEATKLLFRSISEYPGQEENIERFCLPLFGKAGSDYAIGHVVDAVKRRPAMTQIYMSYLSRFIETPAVFDSLVVFLADSSLVDWQRMWVLAALLRAIPKTDAPVQTALSILHDTARHDALRAVAAIYVGSFGNFSRRKTLVAVHRSASPYIRAAIYFSSRNWPSTERNNAKATWGNCDDLHALMTVALAKK